MLAYLFIVIAVAVRLLPHPWHLTPIGAALLLFGAKRPVREWIAPLALLGATDVYLTTMQYHMHVSVDHLVTWMWYLAALSIGYMLVRKVDPLRVVGASLASATSFFVVSNFAVWAFGDMYAKSFAVALRLHASALTTRREWVQKAFQITVGCVLLYKRIRKHLRIDSWQLWNARN